jgi:hypothetical protein
LVRGRARNAELARHQRFTAWARAGVFEPLHAELLRRLNQAGGIDGSTGVIDGSHLRALQRGL